jgi:DNA repair protein RecO (recombination protein O)
LQAVKTGAIVLCYANFGEYDRMLTVFSPQYGKLSAAAKSCRKPGAKLISCVEQFCYGEYEFIRKGERLMLTQCQLEESFYPLRTDLKTLAHATYFINLCEEFIMAGEGNPALFALLLQALTLYAYGKSGAETISACFLLKLLELSGYRPALDICASCGEAILAAPVFDRSCGEVVCADCAHGDTVSLEALCAMRRILNMETAKLKNVRMEAALCREINLFLRKYIVAHIQRKFPSEQFIIDLM